MKKIFVNANQLLDYSFLLAKKIYQSGFIPNILVGIWRGGTPAGIAVHEYFNYKGHKLFHTAIKTESYEDMKQSDGEIKVNGLQELIEPINSEDKMLLIDDVFDTGRTMKFLVEEIKRRARKNAPVIKIGTVFYKETKNQTDIFPDYYVEKNENWIVFPHELAGLTEEEIKLKNLNIEL